MKQKNNIFGYNGEGVKITYAQFVSGALSDDVLFNISRDGMFLLSFSFMVVTLRNIIHMSKCCICCLYEIGIFPFDKEYLSNSPFN